VPSAASQDTPGQDATGPKPLSNLALRLATAAVWVPLILYLLYWAPTWAFPLAATTVCALGARELFAMVAPQHAFLRVWGLLASSCLVVLIALAPPAHFIVLGLVAVVCGGMLSTLVAPQPLDRAAARMGWAVAGPLYVGGLFGAIALVFLRGGGSWTLLAMACGFLSDTAGYFVGKRWGKRPLMAAVSPKKTIEGSLAGLTAGVASGIVAHVWFLPSLSLPVAIVLSLAATAMGQAGDLCESVVKRATGVKESGGVLPGHGGILDRADAMLFSAATIYAYLVLVQG
jgi:phosphatidate cytidylyltransferase